MEYKISKYNYINIDSKQFTVLNGITGNVITLPFDKYGELFNFLKSDRSFTCDDCEEGSLFSWLVNHGFILKADTHQIDTIKGVVAKRTKDNTTLSIVYVMTHQCNMRCVYCYQEHNGFINKDVDAKNEDDNSLFVFLKEKAKNYKKLSFRLYGGEPLLELERILKLLYKIHDFCDCKGLDFSGDMVTNGCLLSPETGKKLISLGIRRYEISLDGMQSVHDQRRPLTDGRSSFGKIMKNIESLASNECSVVLRANVDGMNKKEIFRLIDEIKRKNLKVTFKFSPVEGRSEHLIKKGLSPLSIKEYSSLWWNLVEHAKKNGFEVIDSLPKIFYQKCPAQNKHFFILDGSMVYKCFQEIGHAENYVYKISGNEIKEGTRGSKWEEWDPFLDPECSGCHHLSICLGGCPYYKIMKSLGTKPDSLYKRIESCSKWRYISDKIIPAAFETEKPSTDITGKR